MKYLKKSFKGMEPYFSKNITEGIILNANEASYLPPNKVIEEFYESLKFINLNRYPDMENVMLCEAIAKNFNVDASNVVCGVGSDELLEVTFKAVLEENDKVVSFSPSFSMYKVFTDLANAEFIDLSFNLDLTFNPDKMVEAIKENNPKLVLICSPNNPTGAYLDEASVRRIVESTEALVILDLAYIDFACKDYSYLAMEYENVIVYRTFSKAMALPSIRVGYAISNIDNINMIKAVKAPYSVTAISELLASIAIKNIELYKENIESIKENRKYLYDILVNKGFEVYPSEANFIYLKLSKEICDDLVDNKIYIRMLSNGYSRITIGTRDEIDELLKVVLKNA